MRCEIEQARRAPGLNAQRISKGAAKVAFGRFNAAVVIPMSLIRWQLTGDRSGVDRIMAAAENY